MADGAFLVLPHERELSLVDGASAEVRRLAEASEGEGSFQYVAPLADGSVIATTLAGADDATAIVHVSAEGEARVLLRSESSWHGTPAVSPSGTRFAAIRRPVLGQRVVLFDVP